MILDFDLLPFFSNQIIDQHNEKEEELKDQENEEDQNEENQDQNEINNNNQITNEINNNKDFEEPSLNFLVLLSGSEDGKSKIFLSDPLHPTLKIQNIDNDDEMVDDEMVDDEST